MCHVICVLYMTLVHSFFFSRKIVFENFYYGLKEMFLALVKRPKCTSGKNFFGVRERFTEEMKRERINTNKQTSLL